MHLSPTSKLGYLSYNNTHESTCDVLHSQHWSQYGNTHTRTHIHAYIHACMHAYIHTYIHTWREVSASHTVGRGFASRRVIPKTIMKMVQTASLHRHACFWPGVGQWGLTV